MGRRPVQAQGESSTARLGEEVFTEKDNPSVRVPRMRKCGDLPFTGFDYGKKSLLVCLFKESSCDLKHAN